MKSRALAGAAAASWLAVAGQGLADDREGVVFEAVFRQQLEEHLDAVERASGTVLCLGIDVGGASQNPTDAVMARLSADPSVRRRGECDRRPKGAVETRSQRPAIIVAAGPIAWVSQDEAHVTVNYFRNAQQSARRKYRVVKDRSRWVCLGQIILDGPV
jgi:hypothetical protein